MMLRENMVAELVALRSVTVALCEGRRGLTSHRSAHRHENPNQFDAKDLVPR